MTKFFPGFERRRIAASGVDINLWLVAADRRSCWLHGYPQLSDVA
ncbi:MAG TPA: hypothetical protein VEQ62_16405 [Stellaceae bacterium]|jgi:hypothetical protein|nr:hypothetical protein [Stellaceae bacterium]